MEEPTMSFGAAIALVKQGHPVTRQGWNGKRMFIFMRPEDALDVEMVVEKVKSLPDCVKQYYKKLYSEYVPFISDDKPKIKFTAYLCMKAADDTIVNGWLASQTDMLSNDWMIFEI